MVCHWMLQAASNLTYSSSIAFCLPHVGYFMHDYVWTTCRWTGDCGSLQEYVLQVCTITGEGRRKNRNGK